jgi:hypothetical protein
VLLTRVQPTEAGGTVRVGDHHGAAEWAALVTRERGNGVSLDAWRRDGEGQERW